MFPHIVTIYRRSTVDGQDVYKRTVLNGAYWMQRVGIVESGKGQDASNAFSVTFSPAQTRKFHKTWECAANDRVLKGTGGEITSWKDLSGDWFVVKSVAENVCGSDVDNIVVVG